MRLNRELAERILGNAGDGSEFCTSNGICFSSLIGLWEALSKMDDGTFSHHVRKGKNDFSNWIRECLGDVRLADGLIGLDKKRALKKIGARITYIERYLEGKL